MIVITGAAGFIGSCLLSGLNRKGNTDIILVDDFSEAGKEKNYSGRKYSEKIPRDDFYSWFEKSQKNVDFVFHIGARTDTTEFDVSLFNRLNLNYSKMVWDLCCRFNIPLLYASSAATYGLGELGYDDDHTLVNRLKPLNPYGDSKNEFDKWVLKQELQPPLWFGVKFFNVYGPNEYHKGRMASVVIHAFEQISRSGKVRLFRSHKPGYEDGKQLRDFIYVKDVVDVLLFLMDHKKDPGIYNLGTGNARTFLDLAGATFKAMNLPANIEFIDTPEDIRDKYQYFTEAKMDKLRNTGYKKPFTSLEDGISDYVRNYLMQKNYF